MQDETFYAQCTIKDNRLATSRLTFDNKNLSYPRQYATNLWSQV